MLRSAQKERTDKSYLGLWAKSADEGGDSWQPLLLHLLDVAASADAILAREPESTRIRMGAVLGLEWEAARPWLLLLIAGHDLGKACPGFQAKWPGRPDSGLRFPRIPASRVNHGFVSQGMLERLLRELGWAEQLAELAADAVGCHHGVRASERDRDQASREIGLRGGGVSGDLKAEWDRARSALFHELCRVFRVGRQPSKASLSGPDFMLLSGLTSFADWIGSNESWFTFGKPEDGEDPADWFARRRETAEHALDSIGWSRRTPLSAQYRTFEEVFAFPPRPLQQAVAGVLAEITEPAVLLIEAPMGEGKTEAAFFAHLELQRRFGHRGLYVALPTRATGNAMYSRTLEFLQRQGFGRSLDLQLLHGTPLLNDQFQKVHLTGIYDDTTGGEIHAAEWFTRRKRALLSEYGVGTVDQALLPILPVRHNFVRMWGLANRVVVFDEIHAYDDYTGTLLADLLRWMLALGSSVILLSATLTPSIRGTLSRNLGATMPDEEASYPRLSIFQAGKAVTQRHFEADAARKLAVDVVPIGSSLTEVHADVSARLPVTGTALMLVNTVQRAQDLYRLFPDGEVIERNGERVGKQLSDGTRVFLFHARYPANRRQRREEQVLETFGRGDERHGREILIATQVAEQSLDLDFDLLISDLAPVDLILQRAGRLWRHERGQRSLATPTVCIAGLLEPMPTFLKPLWWGKIYREDLLVRTWCELKARKRISLPADIDPLIRAVYEEEGVIEEELRPRLDAAIAASEGKAFAMRQQAKMAIIGFPDDASWNDPSRYVLYDEDATGVHRTLMARTRLGEDSVVVIPLTSRDAFTEDATPSDDGAVGLYLRGVSISRRSVVQQLRDRGVPFGWAKSPLLRNCYPLLLDDAGRWTEGENVRLDEDLGVVYEPGREE